jgi:antitoxin (DNA-binding transcriptional repressor) of toxin-antitoxin stability system
MRVMAQLDLDDLPPKIAALLAGLSDGEELVLVQHGAVVSRLSVTEAGPPAEPATPLPPELHAAEVFENFRASIEDEF